MGLLPVSTVFRGKDLDTGEGTYFRCPGVFAGLNGVPFDGYEIHMETRLFWMKEALTEITTLDGRPSGMAHPVVTSGAAMCTVFLRRAESAQGAGQCALCDEGALLHRRCDRLSELSGGAVRQAGRRTAGKLGYGAGIPYF